MCWPEVYLFVPPSVEAVQETRQLGPRGLALQPRYDALRAAVARIILRDPPLDPPPAESLA